MHELSFTSNGVRCAAWHLPAAGRAAADDHGRACVVMAHGFGGTRDTGLLCYAQGFAAAGVDVLLFDYRGFGDSEGLPRQRVSYLAQRADYVAAIELARRLEGIDPERIVLWGTSYSGGHVLSVAAEDSRIRAVVAMTPAVDGLAALLAVARHSPRTLGPLIVHGLWDGVRALLRRTPHHLPVVGRPGSTAVMTAPGAFEGYTGLAGPTWKNEVCARVALGVAFNRPVRRAARVACPVLVQVGDNDTVAPPAAALRAATLIGPQAEVRRYPVDHFDVYEGPWQRRALADQVDFLQREVADSHQRQPEIA